jgi:hypothetical protein
VKIETEKGTFSEKWYAGRDENDREIPVLPPGFQQNGN